MFDTGYGDFVPEAFAFSREGQEATTYIGGEGAACECKTETRAMPAMRQPDMEKLVQTITEQVMASLTMARAG